MNLIIKPAERSHESRIFELYKGISEIPDGIIRKRDEITRKYISCFLRDAINNGLILVGLLEHKIIGEIHACTPNIYAFQHILTDLTVVVDPNYHGQGIGRKLFEQFIKTVKADFRHILRIELYVREQNHRNVGFYKSLGFINEGRQKNKIFSSKSKFETPLHMAWFNPNFLIEKA